ncbi:hypothetical protein SUGI_0350100 [Cryptomeria japonica]|nr:hypothetical protein SUGI_0350100 [Cryptomeria japonica]
MPGTGRRPKRTIKRNRCNCSTLFSRRDSFLTHWAFCDALAELSVRARVNSQQGDSAELEKLDKRREGSPPSLESPLTSWICFRDNVSVYDASSPPFAEPQSPIELEGRAQSSKSSPKPLRSRSKSNNLDDSRNWRKYGQKVIKGNPNPSNYYRCSHSNCHVRKRVEWDTENKEIVITTYEREHNHERSVVPYIGNHPMIKAQQGVLEEDKILNCAHHRLEQLSMARKASDSVPELYTSTSRSMQNRIDRFGKWEEPGFNDVLNESEFA